MQHEQKPELKSLSIANFSAVISSSRNEEKLKNLSEGKFLAQSESSYFDVGRFRLFLLSLSTVIEEVVGRPERSKKALQIFQVGMARALDEESKSFRYFYNTTISYFTF